MTASARGLLVAAGTAASVLIVGLVFVFDVGQPAPSEDPDALQPPNEGELSLEARRQARLTESQAMLGGGRPAPAEPEPPAEPPAPPAPPAPPPADLPNGATVPIAAPGSAPLPRPPSADAPAAAPARAPVRRPTRVAAPVRPVPIDETAPTRVPRPRALGLQAAPPPTRVDGAGMPGTPAVGPGLVGVAVFRGSPCVIATSGTSPVAAACVLGGIMGAKKAMKKLVQDARARGQRFTCEGCHVDLETMALRENARTDFASLLGPTPADSGVAP